MKSKENLKINGIINIDKPEGVTSHRCVSLVRKLTGEKRVGHGGTLDPMATGVLPVFVGRATRLTDYLSDEKKEYECTVKWGEETDSCDVTGQVTDTCEKRPEKPEIIEAVKKFTGEVEQVPPVYSALKVDGKKLYEYARAGQEVEIKPRTVMIDEIRITDIRPDETDFTVVCSRGTYVRSLCRDLGRELGCLGTMKALRRTMSGPFTIADSIAMDELDSENIVERLLPLDFVLGHMGKIQLSGRQIEDFRTGRELNIRPEKDELYRVYGNGDFLGVGKITERGRLKAHKVFKMGDE